MPNLKFFINAEEIAATMKEFKAEVQLALEESVRGVAAMTHAKVTELAQQKLGQTRKIYTDNLDFQEVAPNVWVVSLDQPALFIEDGRKSGDMTEDLLRKGAHIAKDGSRYKAIPFDQAKPPSQTSGFEKGLIAKLKSELKKAGIPYKKLELDKSGSPRIGRLHTLNISSMKPTSRASHAALAGVNIYQTKTAGGNVRRDIMTFRIVSDKHRGSKWIHPGREASKFFEQALAWAEQEWEQSILPSILARFDKESK
jgi:hypothetical protein